MCMVSNVRPSSFGVLLRGRRVSLSLICGWNCACAVCGVKRVTVDFGSEIVRFLSWRYCDMVCKYVLSSEVMCVRSVPWM